MINSISITNFKGVKEGALKLYPLTILLGSNNSAKSTILEALFLSANPFRRVPYYIPEYTNRNDTTALETIYYLHKTLDYQGYAFLLHNYTAKHLSLEFGYDLTQWDFPTLTLELKKERDSLYFSTSRPEVQFRTQTVGKEKIHSFGQTYMNSLNYESSYTKAFTEEVLLVNPKLILAGYEYLKRIWSIVVNSHITRRVAKEVSKLSPEKYTDFTMEPIIGGKLDINAYLDDGRRIRLGDLGEGIQSYVLTRLLFELVDPSLLVWDDIEAHLNPKMIITLAEWFNDLVSKGKQVVVSTHSLELASVIGGVNEEDTKICLTKLRDSKLETRLLSAEEVEDYKKSGIDVRTAEELL